VAQKRFGKQLVLVLVPGFGKALSPGKTRMLGNNIITKYI
jgi:hypothetical protein